MSSISVMRIFISYSRADGAFVDRLQADLLARSFDTWVDRRKLEGGQTWEREIQAGLDGSSVVIVVLSPDASRSPWVETEYTYALRKQKRIIPLLLHGDDDTVPFALGRIQYIDFRPGYDQGTEQLLIALTALSLSAAPPAEVSEGAGDVRLPPQRDLGELYREGRKAQAAGDLDRAYILWKQVLDTQPNYGAGSLAQDMQDVERQLRPMRLGRLQRQADAARQGGETGQLIGALEALVGIDPKNTAANVELRRLLDARAEEARAEGRWDDEIETRQALLRISPKDDEIAKEIAIAEQNRNCAWRYANVRQFVAEHELPAAKVELERLWQEAPFYGDPTGLAPKLSLKVGETYRAKVAREAAERGAREEAQRKADQERNAREAAARAAAQAERQQAEKKRQFELEQQRAEANERTLRAQKAAEAQKSRDSRLRAFVALGAIPGVIFIFLAITSLHPTNSPYFNDTLARQQGPAFYTGLAVVYILMFYGPALIALARCLYLRRWKWVVFILLTSPWGLVFPALIFAFFGPRTRKDVMPSWRAQL